MIITDYGRWRLAFLVCVVVMSWTFGSTHAMAKDDAVRAVRAAFDLTQTLASSVRTPTVATSSPLDLAPRGSTSDNPETSRVLSAVFQRARRIIPGETTCVAMRGRIATIDEGELTFTTYTLRYWHPDSLLLHMQTGDYRSVFAADGRDVVMVTQDQKKFEYRIEPQTVPLRNYLADQAASELREDDTDSLRPFLPLRFVWDVDPTGRFIDSTRPIHYAGVVESDGALRDRFLQSDEDDAHLVNVEDHDRATGLVRLYTRLRTDEGASDSFSSSTLFITTFFVDEVTTEPARVAKVASAKSFVPKGAKQTITPFSSSNSARSAVASVGRSFAGFANMNLSQAVTTSSRLRLQPTRGREFAAVRFYTPTPQDGIEDVIADVPRGTGPTPIYVVHNSGRVARVGLRGELESVTTVSHSAETLLPLRTTTETLFAARCDDNSVRVYDTTGRELWSRVYPQCDDFSVNMSALRENDEPLLFVECDGIVNCYTARGALQWSRREDFRVVVAPKLQTNDSFLAQGMYSISARSRTEGSASETRWPGYYAMLAPDAFWDSKAPYVMAQFGRREDDLPTLVRLNESLENVWSVGVPITKAQLSEVQPTIPMALRGPRTAAGDKTERVLVAVGANLHMYTGDGDPIGSCLMKWSDANRRRSRGKRWDSYHYGDLDGDGVDEVFLSSSEGLLCLEQRP